MIRRRIRGFFIVELLGKGGMSEVYLALHPRTREKRAVKILLRSATRHASTYARFMREIRIVQSLCHPGIVRVLESGELEDACYYMMDYFPDGSLARKLQKGRSSLAVSLEIFRGICEAVSHAHGRGVIHRDLKPANVLLDPEGRPMVSDFGIAKALAPESTALTRSDEVIGTIAYLAPEQRLSSKNVDRRADVYALGAMLYEMIMGFPPLGRFPWPAELHPHFPEDVGALLQRCLSLDPAGRPQDGSDLLAALHSLSSAPLPRPCASPGWNQDGSLPRAPLPAGNAAEDRIEDWFRGLRSGTTRERLAIIRQMVQTMGEGEAKSLLKIYPTESDRVRWGLIRVLGELRQVAAMPLLVRELQNSYLRECAIEALGRIGAPEAFGPLVEFLEGNPDSALLVLPALARVGREKALPVLHPFLGHSLGVVRQTAARALSSIATRDSMLALASRLPIEPDELVRRAIRDSIQCVEAGMQGETTLIESGAAAPGRSA